MERQFTDFPGIRRLAACLRRDYAADLLRLLANYRDLSASEAASRLDLHVRTAQDFLESLAEIGVLEKTEVSERKRPYFRYSLVAGRLRLDVDLVELFGMGGIGSLADREVRQRKGSGARFSVARKGDRIASLATWSGSGRNRRERRIRVTRAQGRFLYHLPLPTAAFMSVREISSRAGVDSEHQGEIVDLLGLLDELAVIEYRWRPQEPAGKTRNLG